MQTQFKNRSLVSINHLTKQDILYILSTSEQLRKKPIPDLLKDRVMGSCFFEPSTRTRLSFESAMHRMGGRVVGFSESASTSTSKGEILSDTMRTVGQYVDVIVIRHPLEGSAQRAAEVTDKPVINGGDGTNQHPTQTLLDLFTIQECQGRLDNLRIALVGDLKHGRTVHSLAQALAHFNARLYFVSPQGLEMPHHICHNLRTNSIKFSFHSAIEDVIDKIDVLYMTRIQEERFADRTKFELVKDAFVLTEELLRQSKNENLRVLHPLPRVNEINRAIDTSKYACYFQQAHNGLYVRQAVLGLTLGML